MSDFLTFASQAVTSFWGKAVMLQRLQSLSQAITSFWGVAIFCGGIALFAFYNFCVFFTKCKTVKKELSELIKKIKTYKNEEKFAGGFDGFNKWMEENNFIKSSWKEFKETLIIDDSHTKIRNCSESSDFFNDHSIIRPSLNLRWFNAVPNLLTGLGILGTFIGLTCGIYLAKDSLTSENINEIKDALGDLLGGASLAFFTSIFGLISSMPFSWYEKKKIYETTSLLHEWNQLLNERLEFVTVEKNSHDQLIEAKKQTNLLAEFNNDLIVSITSALEGNFEKRLGPSLDKLIDVVNGIREDRGESNQQMIVNLVEEFKSTLSGSAGTEMAEMANTLNTLNTTLNETLKNMSNQQSEMKESTSQLTSDMVASFKDSNKEIQSQMTEAMNDVILNMNRASDAMAQRLEAIGLKSSEKMSETIDIFSMSVKNLIENTSQANKLAQNLQTVFQKTDQLCATLDLSNDKIAKSIAPITEATLKVKEACEQTTQNMKITENILLKLEETHLNIDDIQQHQASAWENYSVRFENVDQSLGNAFNVFNDGLTSYSDKVKEFLANLDKSFSEALGTLSGTINSLDEKIDDLSNVYSEAKD